MRGGRDSSATSAPTRCKKKQFAEAERLLRAAVAAAPDLAIARYNLAAALDGLGRRREALAQLEQAARLDFDDPKILNNLGVALSFAGEHARAEAAFRRAVELAPEWDVPRHNLGNERARYNKRPPSP
ncbi:MAG: tetratricopeptide repeat protein [Elusimicrobia bacterium]|nr:tetratricopeptide repeat protein [Elusimicrobiota bacterium]